MSDTRTKEQESLTNKTMKGIHSQTAIVVIKGVLSLVYFAIMSRLLTPDDFGYFALITAVTSILNSLSEAGLGSSVIQKKNIDRDFASTAFTLSLCLGLSFTILLFLFSRQFSDLVCGGDDLTVAFRIMSVTIFIQAANNVTWALYMRKLDFFKFGILQACSDFLSYLVGIAFALNDFGYYSIVAAVVANQLFLTIILIILKKYDFKILIVRAYIKEIVGYGGWLTAAVIVRNLTNEIDKIIIGRLLPISDLGAVNRPQGFVSRISSQVNGIFDTVLFPIISSIQEDEKKIAIAYTKIVTMVVTLSLLLAACISLGSKIIIDIFFGSQWEHLRPVLVIFALALMIHGFSRIADSFFRSLGIVKRYFVARLINWIIFVSAVVLGCRFGIIGVSISMVTGSILSCVIKYMMQKSAVHIYTLSLLKTIARNVCFILTVFAISFFTMDYIPYGAYINLFIFIFIICSSMFVFPQLYGNVFREIVIDRYIAKIKLKTGSHR